MAAQAINLAGGLHAAPLQVSLDEEKATAEATQSQGLVSSLAAHVRGSWQVARDARMATIDERLLKNLRARRSEYDPEQLQAIREQGGSEMYAGITSVKCRAAGSWVRDVVAGQGEDRPWAIKPTALPDLPQDIVEQIIQASIEPIQAAMDAGVPMSPFEIKQLLQALKDAAENKLREDATKMANRMGDKMEEQLQLGGFGKAIDEFIDDLVTFPCGIIKGPIVRKKAALKWTQTATGFQPVITQELTMEWERVSPFDMYPSPGATTIQNGYLIERHKLSREDLNDLIGVDGYDDGSIRLVLEQYANNGLHEWYANDVAQAAAEGKSTLQFALNSDGLIDALQYWGSMPGQKLLDWGMDKKQVPDPTQEYHIEAWLIGNYIIKAVLNYDPLHRKPYYKASYEEIPGNWWGNGVADLVRPSGVVANAAARAIVNNMAMSSGPQVAINIDLVPAGEPITTLTPWKVWQIKNDPVNGPGGGGGVPIHFFQPESYVGELMQVFEKFSELADEYSGIPRYMTGDSSGGAGRTSSGLSMLINNAGKSIKQVISNVDMNITKPLLERLYMYNMMYSDDPDLKGDVNIIADGAGALMAQEAAQVRRNEFLAATMNPVDMQIVGLKGRAAILRETVKTLDMDPDDIIPPPEVLAAQQLIMPQGGGGPGGAVPGQLGLPAPAGMPPPTGPGASPPGGSQAAAPVSNGQTLENGAPISDHMAPIAKPS